MKIIDKYRQMTVEERAVLLSTCMGLFNMVWALVQIVLGIVYDAHFLIASGLFSACMSVTRGLNAYSLKRKDVTLEKKVVRITSVLISLAGLFYAIYMLRLLGGTKPMDFGLIPSITIALFSFVSITIAIINLFKMKGRRASLGTIRLASLVSGLTNLMLTQMALLMTQVPDMNQEYNFYFGLFVGVVTIVLGILNITHDQKVRSTSKKQ